ncbi:MAG: biotin/lipoyl-binding protein [Euryarchaeota archaeon]|nr:biotin/lipoyl-binding protein [Euryarchaeota archaeon]MDE1836079.1 biotin/lipoyl-binding protein [Euryarchaeota archaeon]MDE1879973.1 biotin/lipoyl-binding protein [Euryarchaeota archaeon]MDE2044057.1 biotin/lipoyl-binding protein [Thermoplasmata archaeon]
MRIQLVVDGKRQELEVDLAKGEVRLGGRSVPFHVVDDAGGRVEVDVGGEKHVLEGWPDGAPSPPTNTLVVNRELHRVEGVHAETERVLTPTLSSQERKTPVPPTRAAASGPSSDGPGVPIAPPMPGKVLEVRVKEGEEVVPGQTLLVLEAMKMRNEIQSPGAGKVQGLSVAPGAMVKAKQVLLRIVPP